MSILLVQAFSTDTAEARACLQPFFDTLLYIIFHSESKFKENIGIGHCSSAWSVSSTRKVPSDLSESTAKIDRAEISDSKSASSVSCVHTALIRNGGGQV